MNKSLSETNIAELECTPPNLVNRRMKRSRGHDFGCEMNDFKDEIKNMISTMMTVHENQLKNITPVLAEIKQTNCNIENSIAFLSSQNEELKKKLEQLELQSRKDKDYITILEDKIEDLQRENRKTNIEIKNVPKSTNESREDLINMVIQLSNNVNYSVAKSEIRDIYRVHTKKEVKNTPIIVELSSTIQKTDFLKTCKAFNVKHKEKLCAKHLGLVKNEYTPIYISEQLTSKGSRLYFLARDLVKSKEYKFCWTAYGRVYVRKCENSPIVLIRNEHQVQNLMHVK